MARHEILIKKVNYVEPYTTTCYQNVLGQQVPYPCVGTKNKVMEIYLITTYPDEVTPKQKAAIVSCAEAAVKVANNAYIPAAQMAATAGAVVGLSTLAEVTAGAAAAGIAGSTYFEGCKLKVLPVNIARRTSLRIEQKTLDRGVDPYEYFRNINQSYCPYYCHYECPYNFYSPYSD